MKTHDEGQVGKQITGSRHPVTDRTSKYLLRSAQAERSSKITYLSLEVNFKHRSALAERKIKGLDPNTLNH